MLPQRKHAYDLRQAIYSAGSDLHGKLAYMPTKRRQKSEFAVERGKKIKALREAKEKSQQGFAALIGVKDRETVSLYESGRIKEIDLGVVRQLILLGMDPRDLMEEPSILEMPETLTDIKPEARHIANSWAGLPAPLKSYLSSHIEIWEAMKKEHPTLAALMMTTTNEESAAVKNYYARVVKQQDEFKKANPLKKKVMEKKDE